MINHYLQDLPTPIVLTLILGIVLLPGCATKGDIESLRSQISALQDTTAQALSDAKAAKELSDANRTQLNGVRQTAQQAVKMAEDNDQKINKAYEQSLKK